MFKLIYLPFLFLIVACVTENAKPSIPKTPVLSEEDFKLEPVQAPAVVSSIEIPPTATPKQHESGMIKVRVVKGSIKKTADAHNRAYKQAMLNCKPRSASPIDDPWENAKANHKRMVTSLRYFSIEYKCF